MFFNSPYLLITFFVLHKSRFSRLSSDLLRSLFQLNGFLHHALNYAMWRKQSMSKEQNQKRRDEGRSLSQCIRLSKFIRVFAS